MVAGVTLGDARHIMRCALETADLARRMPVSQEIRQGYLAEAKRAVELYTTVTRRY